MKTRPEAGILRSIGTALVGALFAYVVAWVVVYGPAVIQLEVGP